MIHYRANNQSVQYAYSFFDMIYRWSFAMLNVFVPFSVTTLYSPEFFITLKGPNANRSTGLCRPSSVGSVGYIATWIGCIITWLT